MQRIRTRSFALLTGVATLVVGLAGAGVARADEGTLTVTPSTDLGATEAVTIAIGGFTPTELAAAQFAQCGNAYADNTPLEDTITLVEGQLNAVNCEVIHFTSPGAITTDPHVVTDVVVEQTGIGTGNRSCIASPPALEPCFVYVSTSINLPEFAPVPIFFGESEPSGGEPAATTTSVSAIGSPIATGKIAHALVTVTANESSLRPEGAVEVFEGSTSLGTATLAADGTANVALGVLSLGDHELTAEFSGNGSFLPSATTTSATMNVMAATNVSVGDATIVEGDTTGTRLITFPVVLSTIPTANIMVGYTVVPGSTNPVTIGSDITGATGTLFFKATRNPVKYVNLKVAGDTVDEANETFVVQLTSATAPYDLRRAQGFGTIVDDDGPSAGTPTLGIGDASVPEGDAGGARAMKFSVSLNAPAPTDVLAMIQVSSTTAIRGKKLTGDWGGAINKKVLIRAGRVSKPVVVPAFADLHDELDETIEVRILSATGAALPADVVAVGTILSDE
jgi:hypothetical protein